MTSHHRTGRTQSMNESAVESGITWKYIIWFPPIMGAAGGSRTDSKLVTYEMAHKEIYGLMNFGFSCEID